MTLFTSSNRSLKISTMPRFLQPLGQVVEDRPDRRLAFGDRFFHHVQQLLQMRRIAAGADQGPQLLVERGQPDAVLLLQNQVGQRRGAALGIFQLDIGAPSLL